MKTCTKCGLEKPIDDFYAMVGMRDGHRNECKRCNLEAKARRYRANPEPARARAKQWRLEHPERYAKRQAAYRASGRRALNDRRSYLRRKYNVTPEWYDAKLAAQGGGCAICGRPPRSDISLHVDHDHATGRVRRLLCFPCNNPSGRSQARDRHLNFNKIWDNLTLVLRVRLRGSYVRTINRFVRRTRCCIEQRHIGRARANDLSSDGPGVSRRTERAKREQDNCEDQPD